MQSKSQEELYYIPLPKALIDCTLFCACFHIHVLHISIGTSSEDYSSCLPTLSVNNRNSFN